MLEAMASGCLLIGSDTAPVREVLRDGEDGLSVDFADISEIAEKTVQAISEPLRFAAIRGNAAAGVQARFSRNQGLRCFEAALQLRAPTVVAASQTRPTTHQARSLSSATG